MTEVGTELQGQLNKYEHHSTFDLESSIQNIKELNIIFHKPNLCLNKLDIKIPFLLKTFLPLTHKLIIYIIVLEREDLFNFGLKSQETSRFSSELLSTPSRKRPHKSNIQE